MKTAASAHSIVQRAVRDHILVRPKQCEDCRDECRAEAAHYNYDEPLVVRWLCSSCHRYWDVEEPKPMPIPTAS